MGRPGILGLLWSRAVELLSGASGRTLQLTGILGLVAILLLFYRRRKPAVAKQRPSVDSQTSPSQNAQQSIDRKLHTEQNPQASDSQSTASLANRVRARLGGIKTVTISAPGILLDQWNTYDLQRGATLRQETKEVITEIAKNCAVYILIQVEGDEGEAACRGIFEAENLLGNSVGQVPPHRLLFCSTLEGKTSIVRQIEPQLHFDGHPKTIEDLKRFMRLVHITQPGQEPAAKGYSSTQNASSLADFFR